jgi:hypothetical protein
MEKENKQNGVQVQVRKGGNDQPILEEESASTSTTTILLSVLIVAISYFTYPENLQPFGRPDVGHVWYFGWISALSTGLGVLPLIISPELNSYWIGVTNGELDSTRTQILTIFLRH